MTQEIIQVIQELTTTGGAENVAWELARTFAQAGIGNAVIASGVSGTVAGGTRVDRVVPRLSRLPIRGPLGYLGRLLVVPAFTVAATLRLRRYPSAVVLSHGDCLTGDAVVVHAVNAESLVQKRQAGSWAWLLNPMHLWVALRDRWMIGGLRYRTYIAVSERVATELEHHYRVPRERIRVIPNGVNLQRFTFDPAAGRAIRAEFGIPETARVILFVGHEFHRKGLAAVVNALDPEDAQTWLLIVGADNPAAYRKLNPAAQSRIVFAGGRRDMPAFYSAANLFVLPSAYETFSLVCMEAMACSVPILATRVGGIEDYLVEGVNGYFIENDPIDIAAKLSLALSSEEELARLREGARATAEQYGWEKIGARYLELLALTRQQRQRPPASRLWGRPPVAGQPG